ncbi:MAG: hypothetical protein HQ546_02115, partial [Planctomycetes bacterium]|nr:hypothetical protein [Planctomycetota bacterium]
MIELRCSCGRRFSVADEGAGLTSDCPYCGQEVAVPADSDEPIPFDRKTPPPPRELTLVARPVVAAPAGPADGSPTDGELSSTLATEIRLADMADAITEPEVSFGWDVMRSFRVLFAGRNRFMPLTLSVVDVGVLIAIALLMIPVPLPFAAG